MSRDQRFQNSGPTSRKAPPARFYHAIHPPDIQPGFHRRRHAPEGRWTTTPLFYSRSTAPTELFARSPSTLVPRVYPKDGALEYQRRASWQRRGLYNKFAFSADFGCRTGHTNRLVCHTFDSGAVAGRAITGLVRLPAQHLANMGSRHQPATISPCTITRDHDAIICSINDRLTRGPDQDVHVPSVVGQKYPSRGVDIVYS